MFVKRQCAEETKPLRREKLVIQEEKRLNFRSQVFKERRRTRDPEDVESPR